MKTGEGIVTLSGTVDNLLAQERAVRTAQTVRGVRAVLDHLRVAPRATRSDQEIRADVAKALKSDAATDAYELGVAVENGVVILSGTVDSFQEKQLAEVVAKGVSGVTAVKSEIKAKPPAVRKDEEIASDIRSALRWDILIVDAGIKVQVDKGIVRLSGEVGSAAESARASAHAWWAGAKEVYANALEVAPTARDPQLRRAKYMPKSDAEIRKAIADALARDPRVSKFRIRTEMEAGVATLRGVVDNLQAQRSAGTIALHTVGVFGVDNLIEVKPAKPYGDRTLEANVRDAFERDAAVERYDLEVDVVNGVAYLTGRVDSAFEKVRAAGVAARVNGVTAVVNNLRLRPGAPAAPDPYLDHPIAERIGGPASTLWRSVKSDAEIRTEIEDQLRWSPFVDANEVKVTVRDGIATLAGSVDTWTERRVAETNAYQGGAAHVINKLDVTLAQLPVKEGNFYCVLC